MAVERPIRPEEQAALEVENPMDIEIQETDTSLITENPDGSVTVGEE